MDNGIDVKKIAKTARLRLPEDKVEKFEKELRDIVKMVENLPPLESGLLLDENNTMDLRPDVVEPSLPLEELLENAPETAAGCFRMPRITD
jgi:aspartyl/glutamyl-tRNA(Asn/Gln) amidotransferase, C subunit